MIYDRAARDISNFKKRFDKNSQINCAIEKNYIILYTWLNDKMNWADHVISTKRYS